jgi:hypothetical protein
MSINVNVGNVIPTNVVEVGNEISADQLAAITSASSPSAVNPFATASHIHTIANISGLQTTLDSKAPLSHTHSISSITNLENILDSKASVSHTHGIGEVTGLITALDGKAAVSHTHSIANITGLQTALDGKASTTHTHSEYAPISHTHTIANVTGLQTALDGKANATHTHAISDVTSLQTELDGKMVGSNNLSEIVDDSIARDNLGMGPDAILEFEALTLGGVSCIDGIGNELNITPDGIVFPDGTVQSTAATSQTFRIEDYDNGKTYNAGDQVVFSNKIYKFNAFIGAAGYAPDTHPEAWTGISAGETEYDIRPHRHYINPLLPSMTSISGTGSQGLGNGNGYQLVAANTSAGGFCHYFSLHLLQKNQQYLGSIDFSKQIIFSTSLKFQQTSNPTDANTFAKIFLGLEEMPLPLAALPESVVSSNGFGFLRRGGQSLKFLTKRGSNALLIEDTGVNPVAGVNYCVMVKSDGQGTAQVFIDDVLVLTSNNAPFTNSGTSGTSYVLGMQATNTTTITGPKANMTYSNLIIETIY